MPPPQSRFGPEHANLEVAIESVADGRREETRAVDYSEAKSTALSSTMRQAQRFQRQPVAVRASKTKLIAHFPCWLTFDSTLKSCTESDACGLVIACRRHPELQTTLAVIRNRKGHHRSRSAILNNTRCLRVSFSVYRTTTIRYGSVTGSGASLTAMPLQQWARYAYGHRKRSGCLEQRYPVNLFGITAHGSNCFLLDVRHRRKAGSRGSLDVLSPEFSSYFPPPPAFGAAS